MEAATYPVVDASSWELIGTESSGLTRHEWLREPPPATREDRPWLFKPVVRHSEHAQGEDWVEKVCYEIGTGLSVPCARVELSQRGGQAGCLSQDLRPSNWEMQPGSVLISELVNNYEPRAKGRRGHSLATIQIALSGIMPPPSNHLPAALTAFDVFAGYLAFDALIANQDRHDENWAILRQPPGAVGDALSGSYDHASALGFSLTPSKRQAILAQPGMTMWAGKARANKFEHLDQKPVTLVQLAAQALNMASSGAREYWMTAVEAMSQESVHLILTKVPDLAPVTARFVAELLKINRARILDEC